MSYSLYYTAKRNTPLTDTENSSVKNIVEKYNSEYPFKEKAEDFCVYEFASKNDIIFNGSTKLPGSDVELLYEVSVYWLKCLTEITVLLHDCQWTVTFDDINIIYDKDTGWRFSTDEEYSKSTVPFKENNSAMEKLIYKYCNKEYTIDGVKTYIIPKERYDELYHDIEISDMPLKERHLSFIKYLKEINIPEIYLSIVFAYGGHLYDLIPCYKYDRKLYHVSLKNGWVCLECRQPNTFNNITLMPMYESDVDFLPLDVTPEIPPVFKKIPCQKCGKLLNRRFLIVGILPN